MNGVFIALGANLGKPATVFASALRGLERKAGAVIGISSLWQSPAWPTGSGAPDYINAIAQIETEEPPHELLRILHDIEARHGRRRSLPNAPRCLDLDLVSYHSALSSTDDLRIPHPRMHLRPFVLLPLEEVAPAYLHPITHESITTMLSQLPSDDVLSHRRLGPMLAFANDSH